MKNKIKKSGFMLLALSAMSGSALASSTEALFENTNFMALVNMIENKGGFFAQTPFASEPEIDSQIVDDKQDELLSQIQLASSMIDRHRHEDCSSTDSCQTLNEKFSKLETALNTYTKQFKETSKKCPKLNQVNLQFNPTYAAPNIILPRVKEENTALYANTLFAIKNMNKRINLNIYKQDPYNLDIYQISSVPKNATVYVVWDEFFEMWTVQHYLSVCQM